MKVAYGHSDEEVRLHLLEPISAAVDWLHLLPGPPSSGFDRAGGAAEQALVNCLWCLQAADGQTFDVRRTGALAADEAQRWRLACALAGLFTSMNDVISRVEVASDRGEPWPALALPLTQWLRSRGIDHYRHRWIDAERGCFEPGIYAACRCISADLFAFLSSRYTGAATSMLACIANPGGPTSDPLGSAVRRTAAALATRDHRGAPAGSSPAAGPVPPLSARHAARPLTGLTEVRNEQADGESEVPQSLAPSALSTPYDHADVADAETRAATGRSASADAWSDMPQQGSLFESHRLGLDTSRIANARTRAAIAQVIDKLDGQFGTMRAAVTSTGIFVALTEFGNAGGDAAAVVRDLHGAGLLAVNSAEPSRRVVRRRIGHEDVSGVVLLAEALHGYQTWRARIGTIGDDR